MVVILWVMRDAQLGLGLLRVRFGVAEFLNQWVAHELEDRSRNEGPSRQKDSMILALTLAQHNYNYRR